jgi:hypothetical protein
MYIGKKLYKKRRRVVNPLHVSDHAIPGKIEERYIGYKPKPWSHLIYVIGDENNNFKVGRSTTETFDNRLQTIQVGNPFNLNTYLIVAVNSPKMERICHKALKQTDVIKRKGEWFSGSLSIIRSVIFEMVNKYD